jgi:uncharacterized protein (DUF4415 family)
MPTITERRAEAERRSRYHFLADVLRDLETDLRRGLKHSPLIPEDWHEIATRAPVPAKRKVTLRLDADVEAFFRSHGPGHLTRINRVLRAFMLARQAQVLEGAETVDYAMTDAERLQDAIANPSAPGASEVRRAYLQKRLKELGVEPGE